MVKYGQSFDYKVIPMGPAYNQVSWSGFILSCIAAKDLQRLQHTGESYLWTHTKINIDYALASRIMF